MNRISIAIFIVFGAGAAVSCGGNKQQQRPGAQAVPVSTGKVSEEMVTGVNSYPGTVVPLNQTELRAEVSGYITGIFVQDGATVSKGQRLYEIDRTRYAAAQEQARSALAIAEANVARVKRDLERYRKLAEQDAIAKQTLDYAETDLNNAQAQALSAKAALTTATTDLNRSVIVAPFSGTIGISQVRMGALVSAGNTLINTISTTSPIAVDFPINEKEIQRFAGLQKSPSIEKDSVITLQLPGGASYAQPGRITALDRAVDPGTGTITVRASFANPEGLLRAGMNTTVQVLDRSQQKQLVIPYKAVIEQLGQSSVYVVSDSSTAEQRTVVLGLKSGSNVVVKSGLSNGETIITDGLINIRNGAKITTAPPQQQQPAKP
jgi:membrane fusion protein (multidrug efflux system)